jgi:hypothetical protein
MSAPPLPTPALRFWPLFAVALIVRLGVVPVGVLLSLLPPNPYVDPLTPTHFREEMRSGSARLIEPWYRFDALWMVMIARHGYAEAADDHGRLGVAFMPVLPAIMAGAESIGLNLFWVGLLVPASPGRRGRRCSPGWWCG